MEASHWIGFSLSLLSNWFLTKFKLAQMAICGGAQPKPTDQHLTLLAWPAIPKYVLLTYLPVILT